MLSATDEKLQRIEKWRLAGDETAVAGLSQMVLFDGDAAARAGAAQALGRAKLQASAKSPAVLTLTKALADEEISVRLKVVEALGKIGGETAALSIALILQDRETSEYMLAADAGALSAQGRRADTKTGAALEKLRNESWDIQWTAAEGLGRVGGPEVLPALVNWGERLLLSDVRILSAEEKIDLIRLVLSNLFKKIDGGHIYDLTQTLKAHLTIISWEDIEPNGKQGWKQYIAENPIWLMFQEEMKKRRMDYMSSMNAQRDTLFTPAGNGADGASVKDTLFTDGSASSAMPDSSNQSLAQQKAELLKDLNEKDALLLPRHISSGPRTRSSKPATVANRQEQESKVAEYMRSLGPGDSLFMPASASASGSPAMRPGEETLFGSASSQPNGSLAPDDDDPAGSLFRDRETVKKQMAEYAQQQQDSSDSLFDIPDVPPTPPPPPTQIAAPSHEPTFSSHNDMFDQIFGDSPTAPPSAPSQPQSQTRAVPPSASPKAAQTKQAAPESAPKFKAKAKAKSPTPPPVQPKVKKPTPTKSAPAIEGNIFTRLVARVRNFFSKRS